jgi:hypothetical protein
MVKFKVAQMKYVLHTNVLMPLALSQIFGFPPIFVIILMNCLYLFKTLILPFLIASEVRSSLIDQK